jgi:hypothetical protein
MPLVGARVVGAALVGCFVGEAGVTVGYGVGDAPCVGCFVGSAAPEGAIDEHGTSALLTDL